MKERLSSEKVTLDLTQTLRACLLMSALDLQLRAAIQINQAKDSLIKISTIY